MSPQQIAAAKRALACLVVVCALLASVTLAYGIHEHSNTHCCDLCHFGFLPWVQYAPPPSALPLLASEWRPRFTASDRIQEQGIVASRGRAPPTC